MTDRLITFGHEKLVCVNHLCGLLSGNSLIFWQSTFCYLRPKVAEFAKLCEKKVFPFKICEVLCSWIKYSSLNFSKMDQNVDCCIKCSYSYLEPHILDREIHWCWNEKFHMCKTYYPSKWNTENEIVAVMGNFHIWLQLLIIFFLAAWNTHRASLLTFNPASSEGSSAMCT